MEEPAVTPAAFSRTLVGNLMNETKEFGHSAEVLEDKALSLAAASKAMSKALHEFSTALVSVSNGYVDVERSALLQSADVLNTLAAAVQVIDSNIKTTFLLPLQQLRNMSTVSLKQSEVEAAESRLELENEGKKTAAQMSKKHKEAAKNSSDVAFGDLLKIQQSLKHVEKRFESSATAQFSTLLRIQHLRQTTMVPSVLLLLPPFGDAFVNASNSINELKQKTENYLNSDLPKLKAKWDEEAPVRDSMISKAVQECVFGSSKHMEGYLTVIDKQGSNLKYFTVSDGKLTQYNSWQEYSEERSFDLLLFNAKGVESAQVELMSPTLNLLLEAPSETKRNKWISVIGENISGRLDAQKQTSKVAAQDDAKKKEIMDRIRSAGGNNMCADCDAADPTWISINYGVVICHQCSGVHRKIGTHLSKVRSLTLDLIDDELVALLVALGNDHGNKLLECSLDRRKPTNASKREVREEYITDKYVARKFGGISSDDSHTLAAVLFDALLAGDVSETELLKAVLLGANMKYRHVSGETLMYALLKNCQRDPFILAQILAFNDCPIDVPCGDTLWRPLHQAAHKNFVATIKVLLRNGADPMSTTSSDETALDLLPIEDHPLKHQHTDVEMYFFPDARRRSRSQTAAPPAVSTPLSDSKLSSRTLDSPSQSRKKTSARRLSFFGKKVGSPSSPNSPAKEEPGSPLTKVKKRLSSGAMGSSKNELRKSNSDLSDDTQFKH